MKEWDNGYLVVMAKYKYNNKPEEEYMTIECSQSVHSIVYSSPAISSLVAMLVNSTTSGIIISHT